MSAKADRYAVWTTAWGPVGAVASDAGLTRFVLPHYTMSDLDQLLAWEHKGARRDDASFANLIDLTRRYFNGESVDFRTVACAMPAGKGLHAAVLAACREIAYGSTVSYGELARQIGQPEAARAVAACLGKNAIPLVIPCHRVTYSGGGLGGFSAPGGVQIKQRMLELESKKNG
jgi:methylated-DNA-[protein]-cysteine S-methyltransferase